MIQACILIGRDKQSEAGAYKRNKERRRLHFRGKGQDHNIAALIKVTSRVT